MRSQLRATNPAAISVIQFISADDKPKANEISGDIRGAEPLEQKLDGDEDIDVYIERYDLGGF